VPAGKQAMQNCSYSGNPVKWRSRAKPCASNQFFGQEGVENRRGVPEDREPYPGQGEGIVQTPDPGRTAGTAKAVDVHENLLSRKAREVSSSSARTIDSLCPALRSRKDCGSP